MKVLVTGGAGYIGSHFVRLLVDQSIDVVVLDDLSAGFREAVPKSVPLVCASVDDATALQALCSAHQFDAVVHFAGRIQVGESVQRPDLYYWGNTGATLRLLDAAVQAQVKSFVFSSTAAVYGEPIEVPISETHPCAPINPYGASKRAIEMAAFDYGRAFGIRVASLRYFNAAGAHASGELAERHHPETHLLPLAIDAALGRGAPLTIFGDDWPTPDGTCIRDFVHVMDLARAHLAAIEALQHRTELVCNLGSGSGYSVRQVLQAVEQVTGMPVPHKLGPRRAGDPPRLVACVDRARELLNWCPSATLEQIVDDAVRARARMHAGQSSSV